MKHKNACLTLKQIEQWLESKGVNPTAQRLAICQFVLCDADHPTADDIKEWADKNFPKMSLATVYNTLNILVSADILREYKFPHSGKSVYDNNLIDHYHFFDEKSNQLIDIDLDMIQLNENVLKNFKVKRADVILYGEKINTGESND